MPIKNNKEAKKVEFLEFEHEFKDGERMIKLSGRMYPTKDGARIEKNFLTLKVANLMSISCDFVETSNNYFIAMPQYKSGDKYKSYIYVEKDSFFAAALEDLSKVLFELKKKF